MPRKTKSFSKYTRPILGYDSFFSSNNTATTQTYTLSLHDALPISDDVRRASHVAKTIALHALCLACMLPCYLVADIERSEEHTSELQSQFHLVCRLLLEKKNKFEKFGQSGIEVSDLFPNLAPFADD